jgi:hypothetical protein
VTGYDPRTHPVYSVRLTQDEVDLIAEVRGRRGIEKWTREAIREKWQREKYAPRQKKAGAPIDFADSSDAAMRAYTLRILAEQAESSKAIISFPGYQWDVKGGLLLNPDGSPAVNTEALLKAQAELRQILKAVRELRGLDAPSRKRVTHTVMSRSIKELAQKLGIETEPPDETDIVDADWSELRALPPGTELPK